MSVRFAANHLITGDTTISLALDVARVLAPLQLAEEKGSESTHSATGDALAVQLATKLERAWFWLEVVPSVRPVAERLSVPLANASEPKAAPLPFTIPAGFPQPDVPADNPLKVEGVALGE